MWIILGILIVVAVIIYRSIPIIKLVSHDFKGLHELHIEMDGIITEEIKTNRRIYPDHIEEHLKKHNKLHASDVRSEKWWAVWAFLICFFTGKIIPVIDLDGILDDVAKSK